MGIFLTILSWVLRVSPIILQALRPILERQEGRVWKQALPLAEVIVRELAPRALDGLDKHKIAATSLRNEFEALTGRAISIGDAQAIVLAAYNQIMEARK